MAITRRAMLQGSLAASAFGLAEPVRALAAAQAAQPGENVLLKDDFSRLPAGWLTLPLVNQGPAIQENQWVDARAHPFGAWFNGEANLDAWMVALESSTEKPYVMMMLSHPAHSINAVLVAGDDAWKDYTFEASVRPLAMDGTAGLAFRYKTNLDYYLFCFANGDTVQIKLQNPITKTFRKPTWDVVASAPFQYDAKRYYRLKVENEGPHIRAFIDGKQVLEVNDAKRAGGKVGLSSNVPARFQDVLVTAPTAVKREIEETIGNREAEERRLQSENPKLKLWRKFSVEGFGAASNCRFGDLDGDGELEMLIVQNIQTISRDAFDGISCMTAVKLDGRMLWQTGKPDPRNALLTNDTPVQIHDVDGDGHAEVVCIRDFQIQILDGRTGKIKKWAWMPKAPPLPTDLPVQGAIPYELEFGDSLYFVNVSGNRSRREILFKDRYWNFWVYNNELQPLWKGTGQTGHAPYPFDVNGYDHIAIGYAIWDHLGKQLWTHDREIHDHADATVVVNMSDDPQQPMRMYSYGSDEGFLMFNLDGEILKHTMIGHAQAMSVGKYRMDLPGRQLMGVNFHNNVGVIYLFDGEGNVLGDTELAHNGSKMLPVNWRGDGQEFVLLSTDPKYGGMIDGNFRRVVMFPDDGHPDLASFVLDLTGDGRDEIVVWDDKSVWIYTQDVPFKGEKLYTPERNPLYNWSNYSGIVSKPVWKNKNG